MLNNGRNGGRTMGNEKKEGKEKRNGREGKGMEGKVKETVIKKN